MQHVYQGLTGGLWLGVGGDLSWRKFLYTTWNSLEPMLPTVPRCCWITDCLRAAEAGSQIILPQASERRREENIRQNLSLKKFQAS